MPCLELVELVDLTQECPVTADGLCAGHGLCMMEVNDETHGTPHCYCNSGYSGSDCSTHVKASKSSSSDSGPEGVQIAFLVILLLIFFGLVGAVIRDGCYHLALG